MDLFAYCQIENLDELAKENGIKVPRLRGYRLMAAEQRVTEEDIAEHLRDMEADVYNDAVRSSPPFHPNSCTFSYSDRTDELKKKYLIQEEVENEAVDGSKFTWRRTVGLKWDLVHGKARKRIKLALKQGRKNVLAQYNTFNKYVGRDDVLYIHARIGGQNWLNYGGGELEAMPWFIEKVDDWFDCTYCDIYARIAPPYGTGTDNG